MQRAAEDWALSGSYRYRLKGKRRDVCTAVVCFHLGDGVDCDFTHWTVEVSFALFRVLVLISALFSIRARRLRVAARLGARRRGISGL